VRSRRLLALAAAALVLVACEPALALEVVASSPARNALAVQPPLAEITVTFDAPILVPPAAAVRVAGTISGRHTGTVEVAGATLHLRSIAKAFQPGEVVSVNLRSDITATAGGATLSGGRAFVFTIASRTCTPTWSSVAWSTAAIPYYIHGGDLDGDGTPDVAVPNEGTHDVSVFRNTAGDGTFPTHFEYPVGTRPSSVFGEDFDNDGDQDLATADIVSGTVTVLRNNGNGLFTLVASYYAGAQTRQIHGGDFDGDNDVDLAATSRFTDEVFLFYNNGNATFTSVRYADVQPDPFAIRCADLDSDGHLDLAVGCQAADSLTVLTNDGDGTFTTTGRFAAGNGPWDLHANDLDGDGDIDLVSASTFASRLTMLRNDGTGKFPAVTNVVCGAFPLAVYTADLDGDGDLDAMTSNYQGASVSLFRNDGSGAFSAWTTLATTLAGSYTWAHDLDGDADLDLSVVDEEADQLFVFLNGGSPADVRVFGGAGLRLHGFPNPMRRGGETRLILAADAALSSAATADVYDVAGRWIRRLERRDGAGGEWRWNGRDAAGRAVAAGRYLAVVRTGGDRAALPLQLVP
jgi:hypothetical protein